MTAKLKTEYVKTEGGMIEFLFECEGCHAYGKILINEKEAYRPFGCPEDCGATYILWRPTPETWELKCVVCPVFEDEGGA